MSLPRLVESDAFFGAVEVFRPDDTRSETLWGSELSGDGMYLQTNRPYVPGQRLGLAFELMGERVVIRAAEVVSVKPFEPVSVDGRMPGMLVRFVAMDPPYRGALRRHAAPARLSLVPTAAHDDLASLPPDPFTDSTGPVPTPPPLERPRKNPATEHLAAFEEGPLTPLSLPPVAPAIDRTAVDLQRPVFSTDEEQELRAALAAEEAGAQGTTDEEVFAMADTTETHDAPAYASKQPGQVDTGAPEHPLSGWTFHRVAPLNPSLLHEPDTAMVPPETTDPWTLGSVPSEPVLERQHARAPGALEQTAPPVGAAFEPGDISGVFASDDSRPSFNEAALADGAFGEEDDDAFGEDSGELDLRFSDDATDDEYDDGFGDELSDEFSDEFSNEFSDELDDDVEDELEAFAQDAEQEAYDGGIDVLSAASVMRRADIRRGGRGRQRALGALVAIAGASLGVVLGLQTGPSKEAPAPEAAAAVDAAVEPSADQPAVSSVAELERSLRSSTKPAAAAPVQPEAAAPKAAAAPPTVAAAPLERVTETPAEQVAQKPIAEVAEKMPEPQKRAAPVAKPHKRQVASRSARRDSALPTPMFSAGSANVALRGGEIVRAFGLAGPGRVVVDLKGVDYPGFIRQDVRLDGIAAFRVGRPDKEHVRVVIELERDAKPEGIRAEKTEAGLKVTWR
jgi:hypothetical protein